MDVSCQHADPTFSPGKGPLSGVDRVVNGISCCPPKPRKSVSFNQVVRAKRTIHISDFTAEEIRSCWYKGQEYEVMKQDLRFEVKLLENDCFIENPSRMTHTSRGLEFFSSTMNGRARRETKRHARNAVLEEQRLQREEGSYDPEFIADIYSAVTKAANQLAIQRAC